MWYDRPKPVKLFLRLFQSVTYFLSLLCHYFSELFCTFHVAKMLLVSFQLCLKFNQSLALQIACIPKAIRRQVCFCITLCLASATK